jgi:hypothetical protein
MKNKLKFLAASLLLSLTLVSCQKPKYIEGIAQTSTITNSEGNNVDIYTVTYTDGTSTTFQVVNGKNGVNGKDGTNGRDGENGVGVKSVEYLATQTDNDGNIVDTYVITLTNGLTTRFNIPRGKDGSKGADGTNGKDGTSMLIGDGSPEDSLGKDGDSYINISTWDFYVKANGKWEYRGNTKANGTTKPQFTYLSTYKQFTNLKVGDILNNLVFKCDSAGAWVSSEHTYEYSGRFISDKNDNITQSGFTLAAVFLNDCFPSSSWSSDKKQTLIGNGEVVGAGDSTTISINFATCYTALSLMNSL